MVGKLAMSSVLPVPSLWRREGPPPTWSNEGISTSPPCEARTSVREPDCVVSAVIVVRLGSESRLFAPEASTRTSSPPMLLRSLAVRAPPLAASSVVT